MSKQRVHPLKERLERVEETLQQKADLKDVEDGASDTEASKNMTNGRTNNYPSTREEDALDQLLEMNREALSGAARAILGEADGAAYAECLVNSYCFQPEEYEEAMRKMRLAATELTDRDRELLAEIVLAGKAAASSIDPDDETPAGHKVCRGMSTTTTAWPPAWSTTF
jgi:hypothetical protein